MKQFESQIRICPNIFTLAQMTKLQCAGPWQYNC